MHQETNWLNGLISRVEKSESRRPTAMSTILSDLPCCNLSHVGHSRHAAGGLSEARGRFSMLALWPHSRPHWTLTRRPQRPACSRLIQTLAGPHCRIEPASTGGHLHLKLPVQFRAFTNQPENLTTTSGQQQECDKTGPEWPLQCSKARCLWRPIAQNWQCKAQCKALQGTARHSAKHSTAGCQCTAALLLPSHYKWRQAYVRTALH